MCVDNNSKDNKILDAVIKTVIPTQKCLPVDIRYPKASVAQSNQIIIFNILCDVWKGGW